MNVSLNKQEVNRYKKRVYRWRSFLRGMRRIALVVCVWGLGISSLYGIYLATMQEDYFTVHKIVVRGSLEHLNEQQIVNVSGLKFGDHLFMFSVDEINERMHHEPWVAKVAVRRKLPDAVWIYVTEREPIAYLNTTNGLYLVDTNGEVFKRASSAELFDLPVLSGVDSIERDPYGIGRSVKIDRLLDVYRMYSQHQLADLLGCSELLSDNYGRVVLVTETPAIWLRLGAKPI